MALYAFDGTWNKDKPGSEEDTNVVWFRDAYQGNKSYQEGVGTRFGVLGRIAGGITGAGGRDRVKAALKALKDNLKSGDQTVDIVGFSRGAALALHFANQVSKKVEGAPAIRFLGLWDTVPSFGVPGNTKDLGWDLDLPDTVQKCFHAMSLDERRHTFPLHRLEARVLDANQPGRLFEVWFRGVHSDVGGGNKNNGLSSIALNWMFAAAMRTGVGLDASKVAANASRANSNAPISIHETDLIKNRFRVIRFNDVVHQSVTFRADAGGREHNNPPNALAKVDDAGNPAGTFVRA